MPEQLVDSEKRKIIFSSSHQQYTIKEFPGEYAEYIDTGHMDNLGWQIACWTVVPMGLVLFLMGFSMHINGIPIGLGGTPNLPEITIISGAVTMFVGGRLRWMWNPKSAEEFFLDNFQVVGDDGAALLGKVTVDYLGKGVFRLMHKPCDEAAGGMEK